MNFVFFLGVAWMLLEDEEEGVAAEMRSMDVTMHLLDGEHRHHQKDNDD